MATKLQGAARTKALKGLKGWTKVRGRDAIAKSLKFDDFSQAFGFMSRDMIIALTQSIKFNIFRNLAPGVSYSFLIAIVVSAFVCISAIAVALITAIRVVRRLFRRCPKLAFARRHIEEDISFRRDIPPVNYQQTLCRYNC